ncbi:MAG TPA: response regulator [Ohtaekwangia sp.]|nr:response regulator [Ohtaekwangia sp.]
MKKILVCEDDEIVLKVIQVALENERIEGIYVKEGETALHLLRTQHDFDGIITDIHMPFHNGDEILHLVRVEQKKNIPIIMISSDDEEEIIKLALKLGVDAFMAKPIDPQKLAKTLRKLGLHKPDN